MPVCYSYVNSAVQFNYQLGTPGWCFSTKPTKVDPGPWELEGGGGALVIKPTPLPPRLHHILLPQVQMAKPLLFAFLINCPLAKIFSVSEPFLHAMIFGQKLLISIETISNVFTS
jgi:hypothetical protein